jgi:hypothetical protein
MPENIPLLESITVSINCDDRVASLTGYRTHTAVVSHGIPFLFFFHCWCTDHPQVTAHYPPGVLAFTINGRAPEPDDALVAGDCIDFWILTGQ